MSDYVGLSADSPGVLTMVERLGPTAGRDEAGGSGRRLHLPRRRGSAMEQEEAARRLTWPWPAGRNVAPVLAERVPLGTARRCSTWAAGRAYYSIAFLQKNPGLRRPSGSAGGAEGGGGVGGGARRGRPHGMPSRRHVRRRGARRRRGAAVERAARLGCAGVSKSDRPLRRPPCRAAAGC